METNVSDRKQTSGCLGYSEEKMDYNRVRENWSDRKCFLDCGDGFTGGYLCHNSPNYTV